MEFNGTFELDDVTVDEVWRALSDPDLVEKALPGCEFLVEVDSDSPDYDALREEAELDEPSTSGSRTFEEGAMYAALMALSVGAVSPTFETVVTVDKREHGLMEASGEGNAGSSSFEMASGMELRETEAGVAVDWWAEADVFGRIAQMGQRVINPVANRVIKRFFVDVQEQLERLDDEEQDAT